MPGTFFLEIGTMIALAFVGAYLAGRLRQSAILGYIFVGILIGPNISVDLFGLHYSGFITNKEFIQQISKLGLMFLLFFTGLGFSATALKSTWKPAVLLAVSDVMINLYIGFIIGALFGWPLQDTLFLAAIIGMSSVAVAAKSAEEEKRLYRKEYNYLFSTMIVEDFISILLLTFASAFVLGNILQPDQLVNMGLGVVIIYTFFFVLALFIAPRAFHYFERIQGNELFVLFALSVVFLSSAFADYLGIPPAIGAFLVGMAFAETALRDKLATQMMSMKDAFVAIFFVSFGMLVNPGVFQQVAPIVALAVPLVVVNEVFILGCLSYLLGFTHRAAISIGSGFLGRGEDAVLFASVGSNLKNPNTGANVLSKAGEISPFTGAFCFLMSGLTPVFMRKSLAIADGTARALPASLKFGANLVSRVLREDIMASGFAPLPHEKRLMAAVLGYGASLCVALTSTGFLHWAAVGAAVTFLTACWLGLSAYFRPRAAAVDLQDLNVLRPDHRSIHLFLTGFAGTLLSMVLLPAALWALSWQLVVMMDVALLVAVLLMMRWIHRALKVRPPPIQKEHILRSRGPVSDAGRPVFAPRRPRRRVVRPVRRPKEARMYAPVPKEALLINARRGKR